MPQEPPSNDKHPGDLIRSNDWNNLVDVVNSKVSKAGDTVNGSLIVNGDVGIGAQAPDAQLHITGGQWNLATTEGDFKIGDDTYRLRIGLAKAGAGAGTARIRATGGVDRLVLGAGTKDALSMRGTGHVGIGTLDPDTQLHITGGQWNLATTEGDLKIGNDNYRLRIGVALGGAGAGTARIRATGGVDRLVLGAGTRDVVSIRGTGRIGIGTLDPDATLQIVGQVKATGFVNSSSRDIKENIEDLSVEEATQTLQALNPVKFDYQEGYGEEGTQLGFIAEDSPDIVVTPGRDAIRLMEVVTLLTKVVQDQQQTIEKLQTEIKAIKQQINA